MKVQSWIFYAENSDKVEKQIGRVLCSTREQAAAKCKVIFPTTWFAIRIGKGPIVTI